jgi:hypothetical protein
MKRPVYINILPASKSMATSIILAIFFLSMSGLSGCAESNNNNQMIPGGAPQVARYEPPPCGSE